MARRCAAMALSTFGPTVDLHGGGADLRFPHHAYEAALAEAFTGVSPFARSWMHVGTVMTGGQKMAKSTGNLVLVHDLLQRWSAAAIRYLMLSRPWQDDWEFEEIALDDATAHLDDMWKGATTPSNGTAPGGGSSQPSLTTSTYRRPSPSPGRPGARCLPSCSTFWAYGTRPPGTDRRAPAWDGDAGRYLGDMGFYREHVVPRLVDRACGIAGLRRWRTEVTSGLSGRVLEIGFGSGLNIDYYPPGIERVFAVEPSTTAFRIAGKRIGESAIVVERVGLDGQSVPLPDDSCDSRPCTFPYARFPIPTPLWQRFDGCFGLAVHSTSSSMGLRQIQMW